MFLLRLCRSSQQPEPCKLQDVRPDLRPQSNCMWLKLAQNNLQSMFQIFGVLQQKMRVKIVGKANLSKSKPIGMILLFILVARPVYPKL